MSFNYNLDAIFEDLQRRQRERRAELLSFDDIRRQQDRDGGEVVSFPPRRPKNRIEPTKPFEELST